MTKLPKLDQIYLNELLAGGDVAVALIGPGVDASINYERTHQEALDATTRWIMAYLLN